MRVWSRSRPHTLQPSYSKCPQELYDINKLMDKDEWLGMFEEVKSELKDWVVHFHY